MLPLTRNSGGLVTGLPSSAVGLEPDTGLQSVSSAPSISPESGKGPGVSWQPFLKLLPGGGGGLVGGLSLISPEFYPLPFHFPT